MRPLPTDTESLLEELEKTYPPRCRKRDEDDKDHERYAGKVELIEELRQRLDKMSKITY